MSFSVSRNGGQFEWGDRSVWSLFAQPTNALKPSFWHMIFDIVRFNTFAPDLLKARDADLNEMSVGEYLDLHSYSRAFRNDYLLPMTACVWSTAPDKCALEFPVITLIQFMWNHHLMTLGARPTWLAIPGGSKRYIDAVMQSVFPAREHRGAPVKKLLPRLLAGGKTKWTVETSGVSGERPWEGFDEVILACHGDQAMAILGDQATNEEKEILQHFETTSNIACLHSDTSVRISLPFIPLLLPFVPLLRTVPTASPQTPQHLVLLELPD
jgi:predicted NAD/FAD-binding protein